MTFSSINLGAIANDGTGDPVRTAFDKINTGLLNLDSQTYFNNRLAQSNVFVSNTFTIRFANVTQRLHGNVFTANVFNAGNVTVSSNVITGNLIVPAGGFIYGTVIGSTASGALDATTLGLTVPAAANVTQFNVTGNATIGGDANSVSTTTGALTVQGGVGLTGNINIGGNLIAGGNANVASLAVSGQVNSDLYFWGKTVYVDGSPVQTAAQSFTGGNITNASRFLSTTQSTSSITGAVRIDGGLGIVGNVNIGANIGVVGFAGFGSSITVIDRLNVGPAGNVVIFGSNGGIRGTVVTAAQPGITSVGSLTGLSMSGNITAGSSNTFAIGDVSVPFLDIHTFRTTSTFISGQLTTANQPSITGVGTLGNLVVSGNITSGNISAAQGTFTNVVGTLLTAAQPNITSLGTLPAVTVGNIASTGTATGNIVSISGSLTLTGNANIVVGGNSFVGTSATGALRIPAGTQAQRPGATTANVGMIRLNTESFNFEGYNGAEWRAIGAGGATGGSGDTVFQENSTLINSSYTLSSGKSAMSVGPITFAAGVLVTIPAGKRWVIL
jgi:hypothetical protein